MKTDLTIICSKCSCELKITSISGDLYRGLGDIQFEVEPCDECIENAKTNAFEDIN
jgi:hypothetical protein